LGRRDNPVSGGVILISGVATRFKKTKKKEKKKSVMSMRGYLETTALLFLELMYVGGV